MAYEDLAQNFKNGDVIYGLDVPRAAALQTLKSNGWDRTNIITTIYCCGLFNSTKTKQNILIQNDITNAVWDPATPTAYSSDKNINKTLTDGQRGIDFKHFLSAHPKYNVATRPDPETDPAKKAKNAWQRTSKGGLEFHTRSGGTVHFIMTDLEIDAVVSKVGHGASITSAELRWLYRHKDVPDVKKHVKFYDADGEISHKEVFKRKEWKTYKPKNTYSADWEVPRLSTMINLVKVK